MTASQLQDLQDFLWDHGATMGHWGPGEIGGHQRRRGCIRGRFPGGFVQGQGHGGAQMGWVMNFMGISWDSMGI